MMKLYEKNPPQNGMPEGMSEGMAGGMPGGGMDNNGPIIDDVD